MALVKAAVTFFSFRFLSGFIAKTPSLSSRSIVRHNAPLLIMVEEKLHVGSDER